MDPRADLKEATERNTWEAREEREVEERRAAAAESAWETTAESCEAQADAAAMAQAEVEAVERAARRRWADGSNRLARRPFRLRAGRTRLLAGFLC